MKATTTLSVLGAISATLAIYVPKDDSLDARDVDTFYPYTGPAVPVGDWVDPSVNGNGKGFPRLVEPPAVVPSSADPTNNVNVVALSYIPGGINIHYQTPFGLGENPSVKWGKSAADLSSTATGYSNTYVCPVPTLVHATDILISASETVTIEPLRAPRLRLSPSAVNSSTKCRSVDWRQTPHTITRFPLRMVLRPRMVLSFTTARAAGDSKEFTIAVLNDMGYTNAAGTLKYLNEAADDGIAFAWHGGDLSYADDWYSGILPCEDDWPVCYNGTSTELPQPSTGNIPIPPEYLVPLPAGEVANQGGPQGGDMSVLYESNWDLWQQWISPLTSKIPYMVLPGNHEASCSEFDGPKNILTAYLNNDISNGTAPASALDYYSCPPSQRYYAPISF